MGRQVGLAREDSSLPSEVVWGVGRLQVGKAAGAGILEGGMSAGGD